MSRANVQKKLTSVSIVVALALAVAACGDEGPTVPVCKECPDFQVSDTPDKLIENLERAHTERNLPELSKLLHDDFEFYLSAEDALDLHMDSWNRQVEINIIERMFSGQPSREGETIQSVTITLIPLGTDGWSTDVPAELAGSVRHPYCVNMDVVAGETTYQVRGLQQFYAAPVDVEGAEVYRLVRWKDFGSNEDCGFKSKGTENVNWGYVKSLW